MRWFKIIVAAVFAGAVVAAFFGVPFTSAATWIQAGPAAVAALAAPKHWSDAVPFAAIILITVLFGRFFCESMCPLGILQSFINWLFHPKTHVRRVCTRLPETRAQKIVRWTVATAFVLLAVLGFGALAGLIEPYAILGKMLTMTLPFAAIGAIIIILSAFGKGRIWCNRLCPIGTFLNLVAKIAIFKNKVGAGCSNCKACFAVSKCPNAKASNEEEGGVTRREALHGVAVLAATEKLTDGGFAPVSLPGVPARPASIMPPGAGKRSDFERKCIACQLCVANCPSQTLKPSTSLKNFGQPELDFRYGYCRIACTKCGEICPTGALEKLQDEMRVHVHMGHAIWKKDLCVRNVNGDACTACIRKCPVQAIHLIAANKEKSTPDAIVIDKAKCIGCGACEHVCPARPMPAIFIKGFNEQRVVRPISEADLIDEMRVQLEKGASVVAARDGVIIAREEGRGIAPIMALLDARKLRRAIVFDKVIGKAAAAVCVAGGARKVVALVMSNDAAELLNANGIEFMADKTVDSILNRTQKGRCPMENAVSEINEPNKIVERLRKAMKK